MAGPGLYFLPHSLIIMHISLISLAVLAGLATIGLAAPTAVTCTPNSQGVDVCCDQFGGCELRNRALNQANIIISGDANM